jgi:hypothetical protein
MSAEWYLARGGQQRVGPLTAQQLKQMAASGQITANDLVWKDGMAQWEPATRIKGLVGSSGANPAYAPAPAPAPAPQQEFAPVVAEPQPVTPLPMDEVVAVPGGEPWFYGFLEKFAKIAMWLGLAAVGLVFILGVYRSVETMMDSVGWGLLAFLIVVLSSGYMVLVVLLGCAFMLLMVDAGRNLRSMNRKLDKT